MTQLKIDNFENPHRCRELLKEFYQRKGYSSKEAGERLGCSHRTVLDWCEKHGIEKEPAHRPKKDHAAFFSLATRKHSYEVWNDNDAKSQVRVHRLLAVAEYGFDEVADKHIHHKNGIEWDNRPENIEPLSPGEHARTHFERGDNKPVHER